MHRVRESRRTAVALLITALAGCALVRPPPATELRQEALQGIPVDQPWKAGATAGPPPDNWLATFLDPQLDALAAEASARNPDLRIAATRVEQAALYVDLAKAQLKPSFSIAGTTGFKVSDLSSALTGIIALISWELDRGFTAEFDWLGTRDPSAHLSAPAAIALRRTWGADAIQGYNHDLAWTGARRLAECWQTAFDVPESLVGTMATVP